MSAALMAPPSADHVPVLAEELVELIDPRPGETVIDCTFGAGGHARLVAERIGPTGELIAVDRDPAAAERFDALAGELEPTARFIAGEFSEALASLQAEGVVPDVIYMDLGVSSLQLDEAERGFSYSHSAPLDMRMDPGIETSAAELVNDWPERRISEVLRGYGEERHARSIAREIVARRPLTTTDDLVEAVRAAVPPAVRFGRGHPARKTFQALRIAVNGELDAIDAALPLAFAMLPGGGRMAAISFHSLEDRRVKQFFTGLARGCICPPEFPVCTCDHEPEAEVLTRRPIVASEEEVERNPRSRSARLRAARKLAGGIG